MNNSQIADKLQEISDLYNIKPDKRRAITYTRAAAKIRQSSIPITSGKEAQKLPGIGKSLAADIDAYLNTGIIPREIELRQSIGSKLKVINKFINVFDIGPIKANKFYEEGYRTLEQLYNAPGLTETQKLGIIYYNHLLLKIPRTEIDEYKNVIDYMWKALEQHYNNLGYHGKIEWEIVGSYRRGLLESGDIDILVKEGLVDLNTLVNTLVLNKLIVGHLKSGNIKYLGIARLNNSQYNARRIDITMVKPENWAYAKLHATGSKNLNVQMRQKALDLGLTLNEMGLYNSQGQLYPANNEAQIFKHLGLQYLKPEDRNI